METINNSWEYISAIFKTLLSQTESNDIFEPHYIYRGITKRYFSRSERIENYMKEHPLRSIKGHPRGMKSTPEDYYEKMLYPNAKRFWESISLEDAPPEEKLKRLIEKSDYQLITPEYIKSGAAVRLQEKTVSKSPHIDYVNYIKHMINDIKTRFPKYVDENYSDIEILADIQHKGAASCLVDFSNNFLTSLWFATQKDENDFGYLFCYDINKAMICTDRLSILDSHKSDNSTIESLLFETTKSTQCSGKQAYKFWLWKPSNLNERIARQDSVFIFGLEAFTIDNSDIITIPIPPEWKKPIQHTLKTFFGITAESIYCDIDGYADANSKECPYEKATLHYFNDKHLSKEDISEEAFNNLQNGMSCLFQCEYELALKYFTQYEAKVLDKVYRWEMLLPDEKISYSEMKKFVISLELHFSKAVCLKHLNKPYGAINEYKVVLRYFHILKQLEENIVKYNNQIDLDNLNKYRDYFLNKYYKTINNMMDLYYDTDQFDKINETFKYQQNYSLENMNRCLEDSEANLKVLKETVNNEVICLKALETYIKNYEILDEKKKEPIMGNIGCCQYVTMEEQPFYYIINLYFASIISILNSDTQSPKQDRSMYALEVCIQYYHQNKFVVDNFYPKWDMKDITKLIDKVKEINKCKYEKLMTITELVEDFADFVQGKIKIEPW